MNTEKNKRKWKPIDPVELAENHITNYNWLVNNVEKAMVEARGAVSGALDVVKALLGKEAHEHVIRYLRPIQLSLKLHYARICEIRETKEDLVFIGKQLKAKLESLERENAFLRTLLRRMLGLPAEASMEELEKRADIFGKFLVFEMDRLSEEYEQYRKIRRKDEDE